MVNQDIILPQIWEILALVKDPEVPVLTILDLGIVRQVQYEEDTAIIFITPSYSGCPAMDVISINIKFKLIENGFKQVIIKQVLHPAWTTDWMSETGKEKLKAFGIAPPQYKTKNQPENKIIPCPICNSHQTVLISQFSSTSCKALYKCESCLEPFDYFKCH
jgi:ring-1,2-phenylacetyl-CoA epoxidase subunit PaaD